MKITAKMPKQNGHTERHLTVPNWFLRMLELSVPLIMAVVYIHVQLAILRERQETNAKILDTLQRDQSAQSKVNESFSIRIAGVEGGLATINSTLNRIESTVKETQSDVRDLQLKSNRY
jgi:septal ring factor EnvC (AmiA/AmiB activator)